MSGLRFRLHVLWVATLCLTALALPVISPAQITNKPVCPRPAPGEPPPDCENPPLPILPPLMPASISYPGYTDLTSLVVSWDESPPMMNGVPIYTLEERVGDGPWASVYEGRATRANFSGKSQGALTYRVRACNSLDRTRCSMLRTGQKMLVNPRPVHNLYARYPFLHTLDQRAAAWRARVPGIASSSARIPATGSNPGARIDGERFYLGDGYDVIRGGLKEICLDTEHPQINIVKSPPLQPSTFELTHVADNRHLAELLDVSASAKGGLTDDDFSLGISLERTRYRKAVSDETHERFVVKWVQRAEFWRLNTPADPIHPDITAQILKPDNNEAKADFRERCGDRYINNANVGAALYLVFTYDTKKYDATERQTKKGDFGLKLGNLINASGAGSMTTELQTLISQTNMRVHADQVGGPPGLAATINKDNFAAKYNEFIQGVNQSNWSAVDFTTNLYQRPAAYSGYQHSQIFADYTVPFAQARRWLDITVQHKERCDPYADHDRARPAVCNTSSTELAIALDLCRETRQWANCQHPAAYHTIFPSFIGGTYLLGWMDANVKLLQTASNTQSYNHHTLRDLYFVDDRTCLPHPACFSNKYRGEFEGIGKGFFPRQHELDNPRGPEHANHDLVDLGQCVNTTLRLDPAAWPGDTTADFSYMMRIEGFCANDVPFVVVP